ncbi:MAG TPA: hypothetical protein VLB51_02960 [Methylomirabilota bacterium]|nr:hypothetical protein [Methylomirabilota bacterium]
MSYLRCQEKKTGAIAAPQGAWWTPMRRRLVGFDPPGGFGVRERGKGRGMQLHNQPSRREHRKLATESAPSRRTSPEPLEAAVVPRPAEPTGPKDRPSWEDMLVAAGLDRESRELSPAERWLADRAAETVRAEADAGRGPCPTG